MEQPVKSHPAFWTGLIGFAACVATGWLTGTLLKATTVDDGRFAKVTSFLVSTDTGGTFNWLFFSIFLAAGIITFMIGYASAIIATAIDSQRALAAPSEADD